jgi:hypothetical protein
MSGLAFEHRPSTIGAAYRRLPLWKRLLLFIPVIIGFLALCGLVGLTWLVHRIASGACGLAAFCLDCLERKEEPL